MTQYSSASVHRIRYYLNEDEAEPFLTRTTNEQLTQLLTLE